jgi:hypothetical protein
MTAKKSLRWRFFNARTLIYRSKFAGAVGKPAELWHEEAKFSLCEEAR